MTTKLLLFLLLVTLCEMILSQPLRQRIVMNGHEWEVPNEPGWEEVIADAETIRERGPSSCITAAECLRIVIELRAVFERHAVSRKYLETSDKSNDPLDTIFKWG